MSSRQEEKERRRRERLEQEQALQAAAAQRKRLQYVFGGLLAVLIVAGVAALALGAIGGGDDAGSAQKPSANGVTLPKQAQTDLKKAADAAGCKGVDAPTEGNTHETKDFKASDYKTNPPTSGNHNPDWYEDGIYAPGDVPRLGMLVHPLEHGRIEVQYKEGTPSGDVAKLESLLGETDGYHMLLFQNTTGMDA